jgi:hypothetical protein
VPLEGAVDVRVIAESLGDELRLADHLEQRSTLFGEVTVALFDVLLDLRDRRHRAVAGDVAKRR